MNHLNIVETYQKMGIATAIDDFGAGHAGWGLMARFQTDLIKLNSPMPKSGFEQMKSPDAG